MQPLEVCCQRLRRPLVRLLDPPTNFGVDQLRGLLRNLLAVLDVSSKKQFLFVRPDLNRADSIGETPLSDIPPGELRGLLNVARCPRRDPIAPEQQLLSDTSAERHDQHPLHLS